MSRGAMAGGCSARRRPRPAPNPQRPHLEHRLLQRRRVERLYGILRERREREEMVDVAPAAPLSFFGVSARRAPAVTRPIRRSTRTCRRSSCSLSAPAPRAGLLAAIAQRFCAKKRCSPALARGACLLQLLRSVRVCLIAGDLRGLRARCARACMRKTPLPLVDTNRGARALASGHTLVPQRLVERRITSTAF